jgi:hypothetical protein
VTYTWDIEKLGKFNTEGEAGILKNTFFADGSYRVHMLAKTADYGCSCEKEYTVVMDRLNRTEPDLEVHVFPNPTSGDLIQVTGPKEMAEIHLVGVNGQRWNLRAVSEGLHSYSYMLPPISNGIYQLEWLSGGKWEQVKLVVSGR